MPRRRRRWELGAFGERRIDKAVVKHDDDQLIADTLAGDTAAFGQLVSKYQDRLFNTLAHVVGCAEEAEDVVQEAFVLAFTKLKTFRRNSAFYTWLYRIAFNVSVSRQRKKRPQLSVEQARETTGLEPMDSEAEPTARLEQQETAAEVQQALAALSDEHRSILILREIEGNDYETIGQILDLPIGTVRSRLHRARTQLKDELQNVLQENAS